MCRFIQLSPFSAVQHKKTSISSFNVSHKHNKFHLHSFILEVPHSSIDLLITVEIVLSYIVEPLCLM